MRKPTYVIDSYALLAYFQAEPGGEKIRDLLRRAGAGDVMLALSLINLGETFDISYADSFAVSLADELNATVVTGDPEFEKVKDVVPLMWV